MADEEEFTCEVIGLLKNCLSGMFEARKVIKKWVFGSKRTDQVNQKKGFLNTDEKKI
jgi:DNA polymerase elongation subunit (family B)